MKKKGKIIVSNKHHAIQPTNGINIMRGTIWGNPYEISQGMTREQAIEKYLHYLRKKYLEKGAVYKSLIDLAKRYNDGKEINLICCCSPKPCHGDIIKIAIENIANQL